MKKFLMCPCCGKVRLLRVVDDYVIKNVYLYCRFCKKEIFIDESLEPKIIEI